MKSLIIWLFLFCFSEVVNAQPFYFQRQYDGGENRLAFYDIIDCGISDYLVIGDLYGPTSSSYLLKINAYGLPIWSKSIGAGIIPNCIIRKNNNFIITGESDSLCILSIDSSGNRQWFKKYQVFGYKLFNIINTGDNGFAACGQSYDITKGIVVKFDSSGNLKWYKIYTAGFNKRFHKIISTKNNYYLVGNDEDDISQYRTLTITKLNLEGDIVNEKKIAFPNFSIMPANFFLDNGILTIFTTRLIITENIERNFIVKCDTNFSILDTITVKTPFGNAYYDILEHAVKYGENKYIFESLLTTDTYYSRYNGSNSRAINDTYYYQYKIVDTNFNILSYKNLPLSFSNDIYLYGLYLSSDNSIFSVGGYRLNSDLSNHRGYINKMDTALNIYNGVLGINEYPVFADNFNLYQNYPNPFNPSTLIKFSIPTNGFVSFKVYNSTGKEIYSQNKFFYAGANRFEYSPGNLSSGIYFYSLQFGGNIQTRKMVFMK